MRMYYTVYDARTDEVLAFGNATQCAATLGCANARIFHSIVSKAWHGKIKKYAVVAEDLDKEETGNDETIHSGIRPADRGAGAAGGGAVGVRQGIRNGHRLRMLQRDPVHGGDLRMGSMGSVAGGKAEEMNSGKKMVVGARPYKPKVTCDLYVSEKGECAGLNTLVCAECGKCAFYKSRKRAREDRLASIVARRAKGLVISDMEAQQLLEAMKREPEREGG